MTRTMLFALAATTTVGGGLSMFFGQGSSVALQPTTPGTQQVGNANVSGRIIASSVHVTDASPTGQAIVGSATSTTGANFGGFFRSDSPLGRALYGRASALSGTTHGVWGQADSPGGRGVTGLAPATTGNATGVWGQTASTTGRGVYGFTTSSSGVNYGVYGQTSSPQGFGVFSQGNLHATGILSGNGSGLTNVNAALLGGQSASAFLTEIPVPLSLAGASASHIVRGTNSATSAGASGVSGYAAGLIGVTHGVYGQSSSSSGRGVFGEATATTGLNFGGRFESAGTIGRGVYGLASSTTGGAFGVFGESLSTSGRAVVGLANATSGTTYGGYFDSDSPSGFGVYANSAGPYGVFASSTLTSGSAYGVFGESASTNGAGVYGDSTAATGINWGGRFRSASTAGVGVSGFNTAATGTTFGGRFETSSTSGRGVFGYAAAATGTTYGVWGRSDSPTGRGVFGEAIAGTGGYFNSASGLGLFCSTGGSGFAMDIQAPGVSALRVSTAGADINKAAIMVEGGYEGLRTSGSNIGVIAVGLTRGVIGLDQGADFGGAGVTGRTDSQDGFGVLGSAIGAPAGATGVRGFSDYDKAIWGSVDNTGSGTSYGVYGESSGATGRGVLGTVNSTAGVNYGVRGVNSNASGYAVYAAGNLGTSGTKSFVIDHPFDPANKYLKHYCAEGPEPKNIYDGTVVTDAKGWATVVLPDYFAEINKDPRVQLTVNDSSEDFVMVKRVGELSGNTFRIRTSKGNVKVDWEVKATRNDAWVRKYGAPVEVDKDPAERGKYQHPELYGQPKEMGVDYDLRAEAARARPDTRQKRGASNAPTNTSQLSKLRKSAPATKR